MTLEDVTRKVSSNEHKRNKSSYVRSKKLFSDTGLFKATTVNDDVRQSKVLSCCKRVRSWNNEVFNPLLGHIQAAPGKRPRRIHATALSTIIVDIYEQMLLTENANGQSEPGRQDTLAECTIRSLTCRAASRRLAVDQLQAFASSLSYFAPSNTRVRVFSTLLGLHEDSFSPPELTVMFLRIVRKLFRVKKAALCRRADELNVTAVVFFQIGVSRLCASLALQDTFYHDPIWNFEYLHYHCEELQVDRKWPKETLTSLLDAIEGPKSLSSKSQKVMDGDEFLEIILRVWMERAKRLYGDLNKAADIEDLSCQDALVESLKHDRETIKTVPLLDSEKSILIELSKQYWKAPVPWEQVMESYHKEIHPERAIGDLILFFQQISSELSDAEWEWETWEWQGAWEWNQISVVRGKKTPRNFEDQRVLRESVLDLKDYGSGDRFMQRLSQSIALSSENLSVNKLVLRGNDIRANGCLSITKMLENKNIHLFSLDISRNTVGFEGIKSLAAWISKASCSLIELNMENNNLGDTMGAVLMDGITQNSTLEVLNLSFNNFSRVDALSRMVERNQKIRLLNLSWNNIRGISAIQLAKAFRNNVTIKEIDCMFNSFGTKGFCEFALAASVNQTLMKLNIGYNSLTGTDVNLGKIGPLLEAGPLEYIVLDGNMLNRKHVDELIAACPSIKFSTDKMTNLY